MQLVFPSITAFFAGIAALLLVGLAVNVIRRRFRVKAALGDAGDDILKRAIRVHGNFAEYVPLALLVLGLAEMKGAAAWLIFVLNLALLAGRGLHAYSLLVMEIKEKPKLVFRTAGMVCTFTVLVLGALLLLF